MSLVGSLEDLGLADILQIVSLARKSGRLLLRSEGGEGWIALQDGLVRGAVVKGEREGLRTLLVGPGHVAAEVFDRAAKSAHGEERVLEDALLEEGALSAESLQTARRDGVERSVMRMFGWRTGEFRFEVGDVGALSEQIALLEQGIQPQYLAMEATRLGDELARSEPESSARVDSAADALFFSGETESPGQAASDATAEATHVLALAGARAADALEGPSALEPIEVSEQEGPPARIEVRVEAQAKRAKSRGEGVQLVAIDPDLGALEWLKSSLDGLFGRIHIFQRAGIALERIRQYLRRGELPVVLIASRMVSDPVAGVAGPQALVTRLRALAPRMPLVALVGPDREAEAPTGVDAVLARPLSPGVDAAAWENYRPAAQRVRAALAAFAGPQPAPGRGPSLASLKAASERLRDPATQGDILTLVLDFAAQTFSRVAMFMLRDESLEGIAERGLSQAGGPGSEGLRALRLEAPERPEILGRVLVERCALRTTPVSPRDRAFAARLGSSCPREVYVAPIESSGCVVALVYADNLPADGPLGDTTALEIVLHEAGLALDRAILERALSGN
jgi:hypothetical protein